jgi:hypothetical protein
MVFVLGIFGTEIHVFSPHHMAYEVLFLQKSAPNLNTSSCFCTKILPNLGIIVQLGLSKYDS